MSTSSISTDWKKLLEEQCKLDQFIFDKKNLDYKSTSEQRLLALVVELNELINETKVFKFWSNQEANWKATLEEYVDVLHFIFSFFLERSIDTNGIEFKAPSKKNKQELTSLFLELNSEFNSKFSDQEFKDWVQKFFDAGSYLGFSFSDIEEAYWKKWNINIERQNAGY